MKTCVPLCAVLALCLCTLGRAETNVRDLNPGTVTGVFGKSLGTRIVIDGVEVEGKGLMLTGVTLDVSAIDGRMVKGPFWIEIRGAAIQKGTRYRLEGYESGEFAGSPSWLGGQRVFGFSSFFVVTKVIEPVVTKVIEPSPQR